jgi:hypothetical protein
VELVGQVQPQLIRRHLRHGDTPHKRILRRNGEAHILRVNMLLANNLPQFLRQRFRGSNAPLTHQIFRQLGHQNPLDSAILHHSQLH